jgi:hypothetical protein
VITAQHFLLSAAARSLSAAKVLPMPDRGVENVFLRPRWPETDGKPVCPGCGCTICYPCRRSEQPQAFTGTDPDAACSLLPGTDLLRPDIRIKQPHRRIEVRQIGAMFHQTLLQLVHHATQFRSLRAQRANHMRLRHRHSLPKHQRSGS